MQHRASLQGQQKHHQDHQATVCLGKTHCHSPPAISTAIATPAWIPRNLNKISPEEEGLSPTKSERQDEASRDQASLPGIATVAPPNPPALPLRHPRAILAQVDVPHPHRVAAVALGAPPGAVLTHSGCPPIHFQSTWRRHPRTWRMESLLKLQPFPGLWLSVPPRVPPPRRWQRWRDPTRHVRPRCGPRATVATCAPSPFGGVESMNASPAASEHA